MWIWSRRGPSWAARTLLRLRHLVGRPRLLSLRVGYDKAGLSVADEPIPWSADAATAEAVLRFPPGVVWPLEEFCLKAPDGSFLAADSLDRVGPEGLFRAGFRFVPLRGTTWLTFCWRSLGLGQVLLPYLTAEQFFENLRLEAPTVFARLGKHHVACQAVVQGQCRGMLACGLLKSPTALLPLIDWDLVAELTDRRAGLTQGTPVRLTRAQLCGRQALLGAAWPVGPRVAGSLEVRWVVAGRVLARSEVGTVSGEAFRESLYLAEDDPCAGEPGGAAGRPRGVLLRPYFRVGSREAGLAGLCSLELHTRYWNGARAADFRRDEQVVTDVASPFAPEPMDSADLLGVKEFELLGDGRPLGVVARHSRPAVSFTSEGGFQGSAEYAWTAFTEAELDQLLDRLVETPEADPTCPGRAAGPSVGQAL